MTESTAESVIALIGAPPMPGELIASYLRYRLPDIAVKFYATCADLQPGASARGVVLIETAPRNAPNVAKAIATLRANHPLTPIVIVSTAPGAGSAAQAMRRGAQGFLPHLTPLAGFADALQTVLAGGTCFPRLIASGQPGDVANANASGSAAVSVELTIVDERAPTTPPPFGATCRRRKASKWVGPERRKRAI
jgi:hypothetical protein